MRRGPGRDRVFVGNEDNQFLAIDLAKGAIAWRYQDRGQPMPYRSSAAFAAEGIYVGSATRNWWPRSAIRPAALGIYHAGHGRQLAGRRRQPRFFRLPGRADLRPRSQVGQGSWRYDAGGKIIASPAVAGGRLVIGSDSGRLYCFGKANNPK